MALDGITGLTLARESSPELVILDWMLPGLSGLEVCHRLRATRNKAPVILLTAKDEVSDRCPLRPWRFVFHNTCVSPARWQLNLSNFPIKIQSPLDESFYIVLSQFAKYN